MPEDEGLPVFPLGTAREETEALLRPRSRGLSCADIGWHVDAALSEFTDFDTHASGAMHGGNWRLSYGGQTIAVALPFDGEHMPGFFPSRVREHLEYYFKREELPYAVLPE